MALALYRDFSDLGHFGVKLQAAPRIVLFETFRRAHRRVQGIGVLRIRGQHAFYVGLEDGRLRLCVGFVWLTRRTS